MEEGKVSVTKEEKHITLSDAIDSMDDVISHAYGILERIQGGDSGKVSEETISSTTLQDVLAHGSNRIREKNNELFKILDEITTIIF